MRTLLLLAAIITAHADQARDRIGASVKDAAPEVYRQMRKEASSTPPAIVLPTAAQLKQHAEDVAKNDRAVIAKLNSMIDLLNTEMAGMKTAIGEKDMSRVAIVEAQLKTVAAEKSRVDEEQRAEHENFMAWLRIIGGALFASMLAILTQLVISSRRNARHRRVEALEKMGKPTGNKAILAELENCAELQARLAELADLQTEITAHTHRKVQQ
jgi:hypothetical protein